MKPMKKYILSIIVCSMVAPFLLTSCHRKTEENKITYSENAVFPDYEKINFNTYQISPDARLSDTTAQKTIGQLLQIIHAEKYFDMSQPDTEEFRLWYKGIKDPSAILNVNLRNGDITINKGMAVYRQDSSTKALPKGDAALRIAKEYLQKLNFLDEEKNMVVAHVGGVNMGVHSEQGKGEVYEKFTTVRFNRMLNGIPVFGHSRIILELAEEGSLHGIIRQWPPLSATPVKGESLLSKDDAGFNEQVQHVG
ncbi:MAG: hypothetical protein HY033_09625 [Ignavibacteriae bacterium]|nr:hypothetical protein [Ignavibacteriota bacterium]